MIVGVVWFCIDTEWLVVWFSIWEKFPCYKVERNIKKASFSDGEFNDGKFTTTIQNFLGIDFTNMIQSSQNIYGF